VVSPHCGMAKGTSRAEVTSNSEKIRPVALAIVELRESEGIIYFFPRAGWTALAYSLAQLDLLFLLCGGGGKSDRNSIVTTFSRPHTKEKSRSGCVETIKGRPEEEREPLRGHLQIDFGTLNVIMTLGGGFSP